MIDCGAWLFGLGAQLYRMLLVTRDVYRQQQKIFHKDVRQNDDRIVKRAKPHVRPIVRGKARQKTEFGAKISISDDNGFVNVDWISWDNYKKASDLIAAAKKYNESEDANRNESVQTPFT